MGSWRNGHGQGAGSGEPGLGTSGVELGSVRLSDGELEQPVHVVAGVITDPRGRVLLARRTRGRHLAGLWEFPGGKVDPGETPEQALVRELHEELGIEVIVGAPVIGVPHRYPHKRLYLDVRRIASYRGTPKGLDGQALIWTPPQKLGSHPMPAADLPVTAALQQPDRYLITPAPEADLDRWLADLQRALDAGVRRVQLRARGWTDAPAWADLCTRAVVSCRAVGAEVLVNGDIALASALGIGVHLRAAQLTELRERPLPTAQLVAASCHDLEELKQAMRLGCDFAVLGPVHATDSHPGAQGIGWAGFAAMRERSVLPLYAIGGLAPADIPVSRRHGAQGIASIRALWPSLESQPDQAAKAR